MKKILLKLILSYNESNFISEWRENMTINFDRSIKWKYKYEPFTSKDWRRFQRDERVSFIDEKLRFKTMIKIILYKKEAVNYVF